MPFFSGADMIYCQFFASPALDCYPPPTILVPPLGVYNKQFNGFQFVIGLGVAIVFGLDLVHLFPQWNHPFIKGELQEV